MSQAHELIEAKIERVIGVREGSASAVALAAGDKKFLIFVGRSEGDAVRRELSGERTERPFTHDLFAFALQAFDIVVKKVVISAILNDVYCATITLERRASDGRIDEVRLDARASDSIVVALKGEAPLWVTQRVLDAVEDMSAQLAQLDAAQDADDGAAVEEEDELEGAEASEGDDDEEDAEDDEDDDDASDPGRDRPLG
ncbi:MAG TPA: bifunctional nuclease family protein [Planctomycetota bacterium]|nr:bifunctional nuclease family protein [Planctomycetota bacterium]